MAKGNLEQLKEMQSGKHRSQTATKVSFADAQHTATKNKKRQVGEVWEEKNEFGEVIAIWEQKQGYRRKRSKNAEVFDNLRDYLNSYPNCNHDVCTAKSKSRLDQKMRMLHGACHQCVCEKEDMLKLTGEFAAYEKTKLRENALSFFKDSDQYIEELKKQIENKKEYSGEGGVVEVWEGSVKMAKQMVIEYEEFKKSVFEELEEDNE